MALAPAGWIKSSMRDMLAYLAAQMNPPDTPLGRAITASHVPRVVVNADQKLEVALGWHVVDRKVWYHNGETGGSMRRVALTTSGELSASSKPPEELSYKRSV